MRRGGRGVRMDMGRGRNAKDRGEDAGCKEGVVTVQDTKCKTEDDRECSGSAAWLKEGPVCQASSFINKMPQGGWRCKRKVQGAAMEDRKVQNTKPKMTRGGGGILKWGIWASSIYRLVRGEEGEREYSSTAPTCAMSITK